MTFAAYHHSTGKPLFKIRAADLRHAQSLADRALAKRPASMQAECKDAVIRPYEPGTDRHTDQFCHFLKFI